MATLLDKAIGFLGGGPSRIEAGGAAALAASKIEKFRNNFLADVESFGAKLGPKWGSEIFGRLYKGSAQPAADAVAAKERELFGVDRQTALTAAGVVIAALALLVSVRKR